MADAADIETSGRNIGCHQQFHLAAAEIDDGPVTRALTHVAMEGSGGVSLLEKLIGKIVRIPFCGREDDRPGEILVVNQVLQQAILMLHVIGNVQTLFDAVMGDFPAGDFNPLRVAQHVAGKPCHRRIHGCGEHHRLSPGRGGGGDLVHILAESHVQHAISFVKDQQLDPAEIEAAIFQVIHQSSRGCHNQVNRL